MGVRTNNVEHCHGDDDVGENDDEPRRHDLSSFRGAPERLILIAASIRLCTMAGIVPSN
jgi:hypothetical protein